jgi:ubiquinone/menaquinone biosynthesis C-methylase UbiE
MIRAGSHMGMDFHSSHIEGSYATRDADASWANAMFAIVDPTGLRVADIGCGGGIYSRAWRSLGAASVVGIDFSRQMIADAREASAGASSISFRCADATNTGLPDGSVDIVFQRALIHHLPDLPAAFSEAFRMLTPDGTLIVQDRTYEDVLQRATPQHLRGYFFEVFPRLLHIEEKRRPATEDVTSALLRAALQGVNTVSLAEVRRIYHSLAELQDDLRARTGRSILHALTDTELEQLIDVVSIRVGETWPITEEDFWTIWIARKPHETKGRP